MRSRVWNFLRASVTIVTLLGVFLFQGDAKAQTVNICDRTPAVEAAILAAITATDDCTMVTAADLEGITELDLSDDTAENTDDIATLQSSDFAGLTGLMTLDLKENLLTGLPSGVFAELTALTSLDLSQNSLAMLDATIFNSLTMLETLDLSANEITMLDGNIFSNLENLQELSLNNNALTELAGNIFEELGNLRTLRLNSNRLMALPAGIFSGLTMLRGVDVNGQEVGGTTMDLLPLDVMLQESAVGMVVVEVAQGVPFTSVTATLTITGGTFSDTSSTTTTVTLNQGETRSSSSIAFTATESEVTIRITATSTDPSEINNFRNPRGYGGFELAAGPGLEIMTICGRTQAVQTEIFRQLADNFSMPGATCLTVTETQLAFINQLELNDKSITSLKSGDFAGLTSLFVLNLADNTLKYPPRRHI